jgi:hypothetical protein
MAFPVVLGTATGSQSNAGTSRSAPLPANIVAGNLLLLFIWTGESILSAENPTPTAWSLLKVMSHTEEAHWLHLYYKKAAGTEGASQAYSITGGDQPDQDHRLSDHRARGPGRSAAGSQRRGTEPPPVHQPQPGQPHPRRRRQGLSMAGPVRRGK